MKTFAAIGFFWVLASSLFLGLIVCFYGWPSSKLPVEVLRHPRTTFRDEALRAIFESRNLSKASEPLLIIMGASVAQEAFPPNALQKKVPTLLANNFAVGASNVTQMAQIYELVAKSTPPPVLKKSTIVFALTYALFVPDSRRWSNPYLVPPSAVKSGVLISDIKREAMRAQPVLDPTSPVFQMMPPWLIQMAQQRLAILLPLAEKLPVHIADSVLQWPGWKFDPRIQLGLVPPVGPNQETASTKELTPHEVMDWITNYMGLPSGVLPDEQFRCFSELILRAHAAGLHVVVVNLPMPTWHAKESPFYAPYREKLQATISPFLKDGTVNYIDLVHSLPDDKFRDGTHPKPEAVELWVKLFVDRLGQ